MDKTNNAPGPRALLMAVLTGGLLFLAGSLFACSAAEVIPSPGEILPPIGPHIGLEPGDFSESQSYSSKDKVVTTSYFYWYDVYTGAHVNNPDGSDALTDHPATLTGFSHRSRSWHKSQLRHMKDAGIDVLLPVYWGAPSERVTGKPLKQQSWNYAGIAYLVEARDELVAEGAGPPRIGLFYDTSTLQFNAEGRHIDLTTDFGRRWFYESVRDFFSMVPPRHWAMIDGRPIVFLYSSSFALKHDQSCLNYLSTEFARDFGGRTPYVVAEISWNVRADNVYAWGGALGLKNPGVASIGPGYDHSAVPGRTPLVVPREDGGFFARNWEAFLRRPSNLVTIETWNEYHEGTDIAASSEYGRDYIELNRKYVDLFKQGYVPPIPKGPYTGARCLSVTLQQTNREDGLRQIEWADGVTAVETIGGSPARGVQDTVHGGRYVYFRIDDSFKWAAKMDVSVIVEYYDSEDASFRIEFDGSDLNAPFRGAYTATSKGVVLRGSRVWKTAAFPLSDAVFANSQNGGADFRIQVTGARFWVRSVRMVRPGLEAATDTTGHGLRLTLHGEPEQSYTVESSADLKSWTLFTRVRMQTCTEPLTNVATGAFAHRWYRIRPALR